MLTAIWTAWVYGICWIVIHANIVGPVVGVLAFWALIRDIRKSA